MACGVNPSTLVAAQVLKAIRWPTDDSDPKGLIQTITPSRDLTTPWQVKGDGEGTVARSDSSPASGLPPAWDESVNSISEATPLCACRAHPHTFSLPLDFQTHCCPPAPTTRGLGVQCSLLPTGSTLLLGLPISVYTGSFPPKKPVLTPLECSP